MGVVRGLFCPLLPLFLSSCLALEAQPLCEVGSKIRVDPTGVSHLTEDLVLQDGCELFVPKGLELGDFDLTSGGQSVVQADPAQTVLRAGGRGTARGLILRSPAGVGLESRGQTQTVFEQVVYDDLAQGLVLLGSQRPTVRNNVFRAVVGLVIKGDWERGETLTHWEESPPSVQALVTGNTFGGETCQFGMMIHRNSRSSVDRNTIQGCSIGLYLDSSHSVLLRNFHIHHGGRTSSVGVLVNESVGWSLQQSEIHAQVGVLTILKGGRYRAQASMNYNIFTGLHGLLVWPKALVQPSDPFDPGFEERTPDIEYVGNNHYPQEEGGRMVPVQILETLQADLGEGPRPYSLPYVRDPRVEQPCVFENGIGNRSHWISFEIFGAGGVHNIGNHSVGYLLDPVDRVTNDFNTPGGDGFVDAAVNYPGQRTRTCMQGRVRRSSWWDDHFHRMPDNPVPQAGICPPDALERVSEEKKQHMLQIIAEARRKFLEGEVTVPEEFHAMYLRNLGPERNGRLLYSDVCGMTRFDTQFVGRPRGDLPRFSAF